MAEDLLSLVGVVGRGAIIMFALGGGACVLPLGIPPIKGELGVGGRTGAEPSARVGHGALGVHLASGTRTANPMMDLGVGWVFQREGNSGPSTSHGAYIDAARFVSRGAATRTAVGGRAELLWMSAGMGIAAKLRVDHELFWAGDGPFALSDRCGSAFGTYGGTAALGVFSEVGVMRMPDGVSAWTATAGVSFRLPGAVGVMIGIPYCN